MRGLPHLIWSSALLIPLSGCGGDIPDEQLSPTPVVTPTATSAPIDADSDGVSLPDDCDDTNADIKPGAAETCNGKDDNCNGTIDDNAKDTKVFFADTDDDGFGDAENTQDACSAPAGFVDNSGDCDDSRASVSPDGTEVCGDGLDNNCDGGAPGCGLAGNITLSDASVTLTGVTGGDSTGETVSSAGDFNCDGELDLLLGAPSANPLDSNGTLLNDAGGAYIVFGPLSSKSLSQADVVILGEEDGARAGQAISGLKDVNNDGCDDVAIGAPFSDRGGDRSGAVYLFFGADDRTGTYALRDADVTLVGDTAREGAGYSVTGAGDVNGDGKADLLIGAYTAAAPSEQGDLVYAGRAYLLYAPFSGAIDLGSADVRFYGEGSYGLAGKVTANGGDLNDDGRPDLVIAAHDLDTATDPDAGRAYVLYYPFTPDSTGMVPLAKADAIISGATAEQLGTSLAGGADLNADGIQDLLVGAMRSNRGSTEAGAVYGFYGPVVGPLNGEAADLRFVGDSSGVRLGGAVGMAGDINGDGKQDIVMTTTGEPKGRTIVRAAWILYGPFSGDTVVSTDTAAARIASTDVADLLGGSLDSGVDYTGDGYPDLILGVGSKSDGANDYPGAAYLFQGGKGL